MTVSELVRYFGDRDKFPDPMQEVKFKFSPSYGATPLVMKDIRSTIVPNEGEAVVELKPALPKKKFMFSLTFEANPVIEAEDLDEAETKAFDMMRDAKVVVERTPGIYEDPTEEYEAQNPSFLEEVKE